MPGSIIDLLPPRRIGNELMQGFLQVKNLTSRKPWRLLPENEAPVIPNQLPMFLGRGNADSTVQPDVTQTYMERPCRADGAVRMLLLSGVGHAFLARDSAKAALDWIGDRFGGIQPPSNFPAEALSTAGPPTLS